jgi:hypothetical protein
VHPLAAIALALAAALAGCASPAPAIERPLPMRSGESIVEQVRPASRGSYLVSLRLAEKHVVTSTAAIRWKVERDGKRVGSGTCRLREFLGNDLVAEREVLIARFDLVEGEDHVITITPTGDLEALAALDPVVTMVDTEGGYSAFRAQVGIGLGIGAHVQASGLVHGGAMLGAFGGPGVCYHRAEANALRWYAVLGPAHAEVYGFKHAHGGHACVGVLPGLLNDDSKVGHPHAWAFEVGVALLFFDLQLGFDPETLIFH